MHVIKWLAVTFLLVFGLVGAVAAKEKKASQINEKWRKFDHNELAEWYFDVYSLDVWKIDGVSFKINTKVVPTEIGRQTKQYAYKERTAITYVNLQERTIARDVLKTIQLNGKLKVDVVNERSKTLSENSVGMSLLRALDDLIAENKRESEWAAQRDSVDKEVKILSKPEPHPGNIEAAVIEFPKVGTSSDSTWFAYATVAKCVPDRFIDISSVTYDRRLGVVTTNVAINTGYCEAETSTYEGKAVINLKNNTVTKDVDIKYEDTGGIRSPEVDREPKTYGLDDAAEKNLLLIIRKWASNYFADHPEDAAAHGPMASLPSKERLMRYASAPWGNFYYDLNSFKVMRGAADFTIDVKEEATDNGLRTGIKTKTRTIDVDFEGKKMAEYNQYTLELDNSLSFGEYVEIPEDGLYKTDREIFAIVERCAKEYFAKHLDVKKAYKAKYPKSRLLK